MTACNHMAYDNGNRVILVEVWYSFERFTGHRDRGDEISQVAVWYKGRNITRWVNVDEITNKLNET